MGTLESCHASFSPIPSFLGIELQTSQARVTVPNHSAARTGLSLSHKHTQSLTNTLCTHSLTLSLCHTCTHSHTRTHTHTHTHTHTPLSLTHTYTHSLSHIHTLKKLSPYPTTNTPSNQDILQPDPSVQSHDVAESTDHKITHQNPK